jgi:cytoskeletal protein RodZ
MFRLFSILLAAGLLAGCGRAGGPTSGESSQFPALSSSTPWTLRFTQSGGIMGMMRTMEIQSNGQATITDEKTHQTVTVQLAQGDLSALRKAASSTAYSAPDKPSGCADCFVYQVEVLSGSEKTFEAQVDDVELESSGLSALVENLRNLMQKSLKN